jgi:peptidoglycan/xylan/chitin deacetylase (PgdA/CDA1 family)
MRGRIFFFAFFSAVSIAYAGDAGFTVAPWNGYKAAVSLTFDDGDPIHLDLVIPEMQKRGMRATFFLIAGNIIRPDDWKKAAFSGMEIGNHSMTHSHANGLTADDVNKEVDSAGAILKQLSGQPVMEFAYPFIEITDALRARVEKNCFIARGGATGNCYYTPDSDPDWYDIRSQYAMTGYDFETYKDWVDRDVEQSAWTVFLIHAIEGSNWYQPVRKETFLKLLDYLDRNKENVWVAPFGEIGAYWKAQKIIENAKPEEKTGKYIIKWKVPELFPAGVVVKIHVNGEGNMITQAGKIIEPASPGIYTVSFDAGEMTIEKPVKQAASVTAGIKSGFYTEGKKILAPGGEEVIFRGIDSMFVWTDKEGATLPEIAKTGANCVRIVWTMKDGTREELDKVITKCIENRMIPIIELHDKTCKWDDSVFKDLTAYWTDPQTVKLIKKHEKYLFINYGNEIGDWQVVADDYTARYSSAVKAMRKAGIHVPIIIDAGKCGQDMNSYYACAEDISNADPDKNVIMSIHMWWTDNNPGRIQDAIMTASYVKVPMIVGEFAAMGVGCADNIAYKTIMEECAKNNIGWLAWSWGPGNTDCALMDMTKDGKYDTLYGWGKEAAITDKYSIKNTSRIPEYILSFLRQ